MTDKPYAYTCSNDHRTDYWTCPGCYNDLGDVGESEIKCPGCNRKVHCSIDYIPTCVATLDEVEEEDNETHP